MGGKEQSPEYKELWKGTKQFARHFKKERRIFNDDYENNGNGGDNLTTGTLVENKFIGEKNKTKKRNKPSRYQPYVPNQPIDSDAEKIKIKEIKPKYSEEEMLRLVQLYPSITIEPSKIEEKEPSMLIYAGRPINCEQSINALKIEFVPNKMETFTKKIDGLQCYVLMDDVSVNYAEEEGRILRGTEFIIIAFGTEVSKLK